MQEIFREEAGSWYAVCNGVASAVTRSQPPLSSFILVGVYIPLQACVQDAQRMLTDWRKETSAMNSRKTNSIFDFRPDRRTLCITFTLQSVESITVPPRIALGHSDHIMVHLIPRYRQKIKLSNLLWGHLRSGPGRLWRTFKCVWTAVTGMSSGLLPTVWMNTQRLWLRTSSVSVRTAVSHHVPGWVTTTTIPGSQPNSDS